jgi:hypothetical protein
MPITVNNGEVVGICGAKAKYGCCE